jgi:hypothetical protein
MSNFIEVKDHRNIWIYWENPVGVTEPPAHIQLCRKAIYKFAGDIPVHLVTPENLYQYLPHLPPKADEIRDKKGKKLIALKCDVIRAHLLCKYGGLYLDSDTIPLKPLESVFDILENHEFVAMLEESFGDHHIYVGAYGSRPNGMVVQQYLKAIHRKMFWNFLFRRGFSWNSIGSRRLTPVVNRYRDRCHIWPEKIVQPITHHEQHLYISKDLEPHDVIPEDALFFTLFHDIFENDLKSISVDELLNGDMLVSKIYRQAMEM